MPKLPEMMTSRFAVFSACGHYRYWLRRNLADEQRRHVLWIMMNPSRAGHLTNDATTTMTTNISRRHGYDVHGVVNLSAAIKPDSTKLTALDGEPDPVNQLAVQRALAWIARHKGDIVIAWGASRHLKRCEADMLRRIRRRRVLCLGQNGDGSPRFPRAIRRDVKLIAFQR
jgi:hypothetical protein